MSPTPNMATMLPVRIEGSFAEQMMTGAPWRDLDNYSRGMADPRDLSFISAGFAGASPHGLGLPSLLPVDAKVNFSGLNDPWAVRKPQDTSCAKMNWNKIQGAAQHDSLTNGRRDKANKCMFEMNDAWDTQASVPPSMEPDSAHHYLMLKNIPCRCHQKEILDAVSELGFGDSYEFFYLPLKRINHRQNFGYAFIGFKDPETTKSFAQAMNGYQFGSRRSQKVVEIVPARIQGKQEAVAHFSETKVFRSRFSPIFSGAELANSGVDGLMPTDGLMPSALPPAEQEVPLPKTFFLA